MSNNFLNTLSTVGVGGLLDALDHCQAKDQERVMPELSGIIPDSISRIKSQQWNIAFHRIAITMSLEFSNRDLVLLGSDLAFLEALGAVRYRGIIRIIPPFQISIADAALMRRNVPSSLNVSVAEPGQLPVVSSEYAVCVFALEAGSGYLLVEENAARMLGAIRGQHFTGDIIGLLPLGQTPIHERPSNWPMVLRKNLNYLCRPDEIEKIQPNI